MRNVDLRKTLSSQQISAIRRAHNEFKELTVRPHKIYRPKSKKKLRMAQQLADHDNTKAKFDVVFIDTPDPKAKIKVKDNVLEIVSFGVKEGRIWFDMEALTENYEQEIERAMQTHPYARGYVIKAGKHEFNGVLDFEDTIEELKELAYSYDDPTKNNFYGNWMTGVKTFQYENWEDLEKRQVGRYKGVLKNKNENRKETRRNLRKYGRKR